jgi:hypothetical protein
MRVLLIKNKLSLDPITWLGVIIRLFSPRANHAAILKNGKVYEMVGSGLKISHYDDWLNLCNRTVVMMKPIVCMKLPIINGKYGFLDLIQVGLNVIRKKLQWGNTWNGKDGVRLWEGTICSEYVGLALGRKDAHILTPDDLFDINELQFEAQFETTVK